MSENSDRVYDSLMNVVLLEWEKFTPNPEIADGIVQFQKQMEQWVNLHQQMKDLIEKNES